MRGGSWFNGPRNLRSADRYTTTDRSYNLGFRLARTPSTRCTGAADRTRAYLDYTLKAAPWIIDLKKNFNRRTNSVSVIRARLF